MLHCVSIFICGLTGTGGTGTAGNMSGTARVTTTNTKRKGWRCVCRVGGIYSDIVHY